MLPVANNIPVYFISYKVVQPSEDVRKQRADKYNLYTSPIIIQVMR